MKEFFGIGGYTRVPEGFLSWQHLTFVTILMIIMILLAVWLGLKNRSLDIKIKNSSEDENKRTITITPHGRKYEEICEAVL